MSTNFIFYWRAIGLVHNSNSMWLSILTARPRNRLLFLDRILSLFTFGTRLRYARCYFLSFLSFLFRWSVHSSVIKIYRFLLKFHFLNIFHVLLLIEYAIRCAHLLISLLRHDRRTEMCCIL